MRITLIKRKSILLTSSVVVFPFMFVVFKTLTSLYGTERGYFIGFIIYWIYCITISSIVFRQNDNKFIDIFRINLKTNKYSVIFSLLTLIPVFGVFYIQFLPNVDLLTKGLLLLVLTNAILNGLIEELYWRGLYLLEFKQNIWLGFCFSTFFFGVWHIALYTIQDIDYGGFFPLVAGAFFMGLLWSFCTRQLNSITFPVIAHVLVNIFAFTGLYINNGF